MASLKYQKEFGNGYPQVAGFGAPVSFPKHLPLKQEELEEIQYSYTAHAEVFDLTVDEDKKKYVEVLDRIANGMWIRLSPVIREFDAKNKRMVVYVEWATVIGDLPRHILNRITGEPAGPQGII